MEKQEIILELVKSLNVGNCGYVSDRVSYANKQYEQLVERGLIDDVDTLIKIKEKQENKEI